MLESQQQASGQSLDLPTFDDDLELFDEPFIEKPAPPWWRRRGPVALVAGVLLVIILGGAGAYALTHRQPTITYQTAQVTQGNLAVTVAATGPVAGATYAANFAVTGKIAVIAVSLGQKVAAGQVLAKLDPTALQDALNQAQNQANSAFDQEQNQIFTCQQEAARGTEPPNCVQAAEDQYQGAVDQLRTAKDNLANATLTAPHAGIVAAINGQVGGAPGTGSSSGSSGSASASSGSGFIVIVDTSALQVTADVNEADIGKVAPGEGAAFTVSAFSTRRFQGTVTQVSIIGQTTSNVVTYPVTITVNMATVNGAGLLPGMTANVEITTAQRSGVELVSAGAVTFARTALSAGAVTRAAVLAAVQQARQMLAAVVASDKNAQADNPTASFVLERSGGKWVVKPVVLGLTNGTEYVVMAGLNDGETVITGQVGGTTTTSGTTTGGGGLFGGGRGGFGGGGGRGGNGGGTGGGGTP